MMSCHCGSFSTETTVRARLAKKRVEPPAPYSNTSMSFPKYDFNHRIARNVIQGMDSLSGVCRGSSDRNQGARNWTERGSFDRVANTSPKISRFGVGGLSMGTDLPFGTALPALLLPMVVNHLKLLKAKRQFSGPK